MIESIAWLVLWLVVVAIVVRPLARLGQFFLGVASAALDDARTGVAAAIGIPAGLYGIGVIVLWVVAIVQIAVNAFAVLGHLTA